MLSLLLLAACARRPPADAGAPLPSPAEAAAPEAAPAPPRWLGEVLPLLRASDWAGADALLGQTLLRPELPPQERTLALWYRASVRAQMGDRVGEIEDLRGFVTTSRLIHIAGDGPGALLMHRVALAELAVAAADASEDPSVGASRERAIAVMLASDEDFFLGRLACGPGLGGAYAVVTQELVHGEDGVFDRVELRCEADGSPREVWFDLAFWWSLLGFSLGAAPPPEGLEPEGARALLQLLVE